MDWKRSKTYEYLDKWYQFMEKLHERERYYELSMKELVELCKAFMHEEDISSMSESGELCFVRKWLKDRGIDG